MREGDDRIRRVPRVDEKQEHWARLEKEDADQVERWLRESFLTAETTMNDADGPIVPTIEKIRIDGLPRAMTMIDGVPCDR